MIRAPFGVAEVLRKLRPAFHAAPLRSLLLPGACHPDALQLPPFSKFHLANRGRYEIAELEDPALGAELHSFAQHATGLLLEPAGPLRLFRFRHRGYALFLDDALTRITTGVELTLDLSRQMCGPPSVYQSGPAQRLEIPQAPGLVAVVERTPAIWRYDRYLPAEVGDAEVLRLRAAFRCVD